MSLVQLAIALLTNLLSQYKSAGAALSIIQEVEAAREALFRARSVEVTEGELESLRVGVPWDKN